MEKQHITAVLIRIFFGLFLAFAAGICIYLFQVEYSDFVYTILKKADKLFLLEKIKNDIFPPEKFAFIKYFSIFLTLSAFALFIFFRKKIPHFAASIINDFREFKTVAKRSWRCFCAGSKYENILLALIFILLTAKGFYYLITIDIQYDEAWTYNYFTSGNFFFFAFVYSNHPLYIFLTNIFAVLPLDPEIALRLPAFLSGLVAAGFLYLFIKRFFNNKLALIALAFFAFSPPVTFYMLYARAYILVILFTILAAFALFQALFHREQKVYWLILACASVLGFYSMPTFLYPFLSLSFFAVLVTFRKPALFKKVIKMSLITGLIVFLLYLPMMLGTGIQFGLDVAVGGIAMTSLIAYFPKYFHESTEMLVGTAFSEYIYLILAGIFVFAALFSKNKKIKYFSIAGLIAFILPLPAVLIQQVIIPERIWVYLIFFVTLAVAVGIYLLRRQINIWATYALAIFFISANAIIAHHHDFLNWSKGLDESSKKVAAVLMSRNIENCYLNYDYYKPNLIFYHNIHNKKINITLANPQSLEYRPFSPEQYDCVIWKKQDHPPPALHNYQDYYSDEFVKVYLR